MPILTVLVGLPGSGKSTSILEDFDGFVYSTDQFIEDAAKHFNITYNEAFSDNIKAATLAMDQKLSDAIAAKSDVVWDQTNMSAKKRRSIVARFPNFYSKYCICRVPPRDNDEWAELNRRILSRKGKMIPSHVVESMAKSYTAPTREEGFDVIHFYDIYGNFL